MLSKNDVAAAYVSFMRGDGQDLLALVGHDFFDNVSKQRGSQIWRTVAAWLAASFADADVELHAVAEDDDGLVLVWITFHATHVGSGFPFMADRVPTHRRVAWAQLHVFRTVGDKIVEHWAVRDDLRVLEAIDRSAYEPVTAARFYVPLGAAPQAGGDGRAPDGSANRSTVRTWTSIAPAARGRPGPGPARTGSHPHRLRARTRPYRVGAPWAGSLARVCRDLSAVSCNPDSPGTPRCRSRRSLS